MAGKKVLFAVARHPYPLDTGAKIRTWHILAGYAAQYDVDVLHFAAPDTDPAWEAQARGLGVNRIFSVENQALGRPTSLMQFVQAIVNGLPVSTVKYVDGGFSKKLVELAPEYNIVHIDTIHLAGDIAPLKGSSASPFIILNAHNVECQIAERMRELEKSPLRKFALSVQARNMRKFEEKAFAAADLVLSVSAEDMEQIDAMAGTSGKGLLVENGVDTDFHTPGTPDEEQEKTLVFVGAMDWLPNVDGMKWFMAESFPLIKEEIPDVGMTIVGRNPHPSILMLHDPDNGVTVTGTVDDIRPYVRSAAVEIVPLRFGGGTRLKITEAFAMGKAVVSTSLGCEGIVCENDRELAIRDTGETFARACVELLRDIVKRREMGRQGLDLARKVYAWPVVVGRMHDDVAARMAER